MAVTSLFVGIPAFAATPTYTATDATAQAFAPNLTVVTETNDDGTTYNTVKNVSYYSFTPATTGTYAIALNSTATYGSYDSTTGTTAYSTTYTDGAYRCDDASVTVYEDANQDEYLTSVDSWNSYTTSYSYDAEDNMVVADQATRQYISGYTTVELQAGKTYYISAQAYADYSRTYTDGTLTGVDVKFATQASFSITAVDWTYSLNYSTESVKVTVPTTYNEDGYVTRTIYKDFGISTSYVGSATTVTVPETINGIAVTSLTGTTNKAITSLTLSSGIKSIGRFSNLLSLASVTLNSGLESILSSAFSGDSALTSITVPATVKTIDSSAFYNCSALSSVTLSSGLKTIGSDAFYNIALAGLVIPSTVTSIGAYAVGFVSNLDTNTVSPYDTVATAVDSFAIGSVSNDVVQKYAAQYGISYYDMTFGCPHPYNYTTVAATFFSKGSKTGVCPLCGKTTKKTIKKKTFKIKSVKSSKKGTLTVKVAKKSGVTGYQVQYSTSKKFTKKTTKIVKVTGTKVNKKITGLTSSKKYYVRVRAYSTSNGKTVYSKYTATKSVKVK
ncbi:MAG: leucine-rich repeat domain-containing protein [Clostridiales bacterium]|nr:leucine-rich repeat domain-containing protein [Clostridiales bacterium]